MTIGSQANGAEASQAPAAGQSVEKWILEAVATMSGGGPVPSRDARLEQLDLDSLDMVEIWQLLQDDLDIVIDPADFGEAVTIGDVIDIVEEAQR
jgi:acyl carrier protein